ncbi:MAG: 2-amino-4-hydroxy-6-hydroxymethyldihydropteridine diphosphokinase [Coriobacteriia bacterium]|nr:2-amino-4-hydroxy-6-hydroxymethyldihydropteridine diphosphokinase [Coriobacteriia bacterium]
MDTAYIGLGSNLDPRMLNLASALEAVAHLPETHVKNVSNAYESQPAYVESQPLFLNAVAEVTTGLLPEALLGHLLDIETDMGRVRGDDKGPRVIDLDLLLYGSEEMVSESLTLPHPGLAERDFVVTPLLEIAPDIILPDGTRPGRLGTMVGCVTRDAGPIPDAGAGHDVPVEPAEWVAIASSEDVTDRIAGFDAALQFKRQVLEGEGIPVGWEPYEPGTDVDPFGMMIVFSLLVPVADEERARTLLAQVEAAPSELSFDEGEEPAEPVV